jgi:hypothetical protein
MNEKEGKMAIQNQQQIEQLRAEAQHLAKKLHLAKIKLDKTSHWLGMDRAVNRENWRFFRLDKPGPWDIMSNEYIQAGKAYREAKKKYWKAKSQLDFVILRSTPRKDKEKAVRAAVSKARNHMNQTFGPQIVKAAGDTGEFYLSEHPEMVKELETSINEAIIEARRNPSQPTVAALIETLAAAFEAGYDNLKPGHIAHTWQQVKHIINRIIHNKVHTLGNAGIKL